MKSEELVTNEAERTDNSLRSQDINGALKDHATAAEDWGYHELAQLLHEWAERFDNEFGLNIKTPAIQINRIYIRRLGSYQHGRNGFGLRHQVTFNTRYLERPVADLLETLFHELLHEWQDLYGKPGKGNYHNREFREKACSYGLLIDQRGRSLGVEQGSFTELLARYGVDTSVLPLPQKEPVPQDDPVMSQPSSESKMKKWSCKCTNVRAAVELEARCLKCGALFQRANSAW